MEKTLKKNSIVLLLGLAGFIVMADNWVVSPILPAIAGGIGADVSKAGLLITAYNGTLWNNVCNRWKAKW